MWKNSELTDAGTDTCCTMSICDKDWYLAEHPNTVVSRTQDSVTVRGIGSSRHASSEYVQANLYLEGESNWMHITPGNKKEFRFMRIYSKGLHKSVNWPQFRAIETILGRKMSLTWALPAPVKAASLARRCYGSSRTRLPCHVAYPATSIFLDKTGTMTRTMMEVPVMTFVKTIRYPSYCRRLFSAPSSSPFRVR